MEQEAGSLATLLQKNSGWLYGLLGYGGGILTLWLKDLLQQKKEHRAALSERENHRREVIDETLEALDGWFKDFRDVLVGIESTKRVPEKELDLLKGKFVSLLTLTETKGGYLPSESLGRIKDTMFLQNFVLEEAAKHPEIALIGPYNIFIEKYDAAVKSLQENQKSRPGELPD